jgi:transcriptional regulator with XRE-family HTH domain
MSLAAMTRAVALGRLTKKSRCHFGVIGGTVARVDTKPKPNVTLRNVRQSMHLSLDEFANRLRRAGAESTSKRHVARLENGEIVMPRPSTIRALEAVTGLPITSLGFPAGSDAMVVEDGRGGHDLLVRESRLPAASGPTRPHGRHTGVWLSTYEFFSSGRDQSFVNSHYVVLLQHDDRLTARSLNGPEKSLLTMDLMVDGSVITGTWVEETERGGYYRGARYYGAIQMIAEPTGRRITGKWVGFGRDMEINTGPWSLVFVDESTGKETLTKYSTPPEGGIQA